MVYSMKRHCYLLLTLLALVAFNACSNEDENSYEITLDNLACRWQQDGAILAGETGYLILHLNTNGSGHVVFRTQALTDPVVYYDEITYSLNGKILTIYGSNLAGTYTIEQCTRTLTLRNVATNLLSIFSLAVQETSILKYNWKLNTTDSALHNYYLFEFGTSGTGKMTWIGNTNAEQTVYNFTYSLDYANGPMTIKYSDGSQSHYFYTVFLGGNFLLFYRDTTVRYLLLHPRTK